MTDRDFIDMLFFDCSATEIDCVECRKYFNKDGCINRFEVMEKLKPLLKDEVIEEKDPLEIIGYKKEESELRILYFKKYTRICLFKDCNSCISGLEVNSIINDHVVKNSQILTLEELQAVNKIIDDINQE